jgi:hypothetical protein
MCLHSLKRCSMHVRTIALHILKMCSEILQLDPLIVGWKLADGSGLTCYHDLERGDFVIELLDIFGVFMKSIPAVIGVRSMIVAHDLSSKYYPLQNVSLEPGNSIFYHTSCEYIGMQNRNAIQAQLQTALILYKFFRKVRLSVKKYKKTVLSFINFCTYFTHLGLNISSRFLITSSS